MCLAIPGKVVEVKGKNIVVQYPGGKRPASNFGFDVKKGDYVIVQARMVVQKIPKDEALESLKMWREAGKK